MKSREQIEEKYKWDLTKYYASEEKVEEEIELAKKTYLSLEKFKGKLNTFKNIDTFFTYKEKLEIILNKLYIYSYSKFSEDVTNSKNVELFDRVKMVWDNAYESISFYRDDLKKLSNEKLNNLIKEDIDKKYVDLFETAKESKKYKTLKNHGQLRRAISNSLIGFKENFDMFDSADVKFEDITDSKGNKYSLNNSNYMNFITSKDRELRKNASLKMKKAYADLKNILANNYINYVKADCLLAQIEGYDSCLEYRLDEENVDFKTFALLVNTTNENLHLFHKNYDIKRRLLKLDKIANYDFLTPINNITLNLSFEESLEIVKKACAPLGKDYTDLLTKAKNERWIDIMTNSGKQPGAYSWGAYSSTPLVSLNWSNTTEDVFTLSHELGHAMHNYYSNKNQPFYTAEYEKFTAEIASTVNEMLLARYLIDNARSNEEKLFALDHTLNTIRNCMLETKEAEFEYFAHKEIEDGNSLSLEKLNNLYLDLSKQYFGDNVEILEETKYTWLSISHFYRSFYVYKYATGMISAILITNNLCNNKNNAREKYIKFLSSGCSKPPMELLKDIDVDLTKEETFNKAFEIIKSYIEEYEKLANQTLSIDKEKDSLTI